MTNRKGFFRSTVDAMVEARVRRANAYVNGALLMLDDETLRIHGYNRKDLEKRPTAYHSF
ncbi:MAG: hypothetical protein U5K75_03665 [Ahrensia sp.]|nr:hypothetical protein [Ahrensia sp.]